jgi:hypothetical protein
MKPTEGEALVDAEVVVIGNSTPEIQTMAAELRDEQIVIDLDRSFGSRRSGATYQGICW